MTCVHCGAELAPGRRHFNPWLGTWECRPACEAERAWYAEYTREVGGYRDLWEEKRAAVRERRRMIQEAGWRLA